MKEIARVFPLLVLATTLTNIHSTEAIPTCPEDGSVIAYFQHESDCSKFYTCSNGEPILQNCSSGLYFNPLTNVCDWPFNVDCKNKDESSEADNDKQEENSSISEESIDRDPECPFPDPVNHTVHLPHENNCSLFYKCDHGKKVLFNCPGDLYFNSKLEACDWPSNVDCKNGNGSESAPENGDKPTESEENNEGSEEAEPEVPEDQDDNSEEEDENAEENNSESEDTEGENKEENEEGSPESKPEEPEANSEEDGNSENDESGYSSGETNDRDPECPFPDPLNHTVHLPHEYDCSKFYKCDNGKKVSFDCPDGLYFNPILDVCDWPENVNCSNNGTVPSTTLSPLTTTTAPGNSTESVETTTASQPPPEETTLAPSTGRDPECPFPDPLNHTVHLPHEYDCSKFYKCDNGKKVSFDCPDGLYFNPILEVCDWPENVNCSNNGTVPSTTLTPPITTPAPETPTESVESTPASQPPIEETTLAPSTTAAPETSPQSTPELEESTLVPTTTEVTEGDDDDSGESTLQPEHTTPIPTEPETLPPTTTETDDASSETTTESTPSDVETTQNENAETTPIPTNAPEEPETDNDETTLPPTTSTAEDDNSEDSSSTPAIETTTTTPEEGDNSQEDNGVIETTLAPTPESEDDGDHTTAAPTTTYPDNDDQEQDDDDGGEGEITTPTPENEENSDDEGSQEHQDGDDNNDEDAATTLAPDGDDDDDVEEQTPSPGEDEEPQETECPKDCQESTVYLPFKHGYSKNKYIRCDSGEELVEECPSGLIFDPKRRVCNVPDNCPLTRCTNPSKYSGLPGSIYQYIKCVKGADVVVSCPNGLLFDAKTSQCNLPHRV